MSTSTTSMRTRSRSAAVDPRRVGGLARANLRLMTRNMVTLLYAFVLPLAPMALLLGGGGPSAQRTAVATVLLLALLFPVYYNTLSQIVTRRDELVLKRLRSGEATDAEILTAVALPGTVIALLVSALVVPIGAAAGMDLPGNPLLYLVGVLACSVMFATFAIWTAAWTRNAEAAQLTSAPVLVLAMIGTMSGVFPDRVARWIELTPGGVVTELVELTWSADGLLDGWADAARALVALVCWIALAAALARRSMRWEPRG